MNNLYSNPKRKLTISYVVALSLVALLSIGSQYIIRDVIGDHKDDAGIINLSGRQRMLSQKISKMALQLTYSEHEKEYLDLLQLFQKTTAEWRKAHISLCYRDDAAHMNGDNSAKTQKYFLRLQPHFLEMDNAIQNIIESAFSDDIKLPLNQILAHEKEFLELMNTITFQYEKEAALRLHRVETLERVPLFITIISLILEALIIFRPAVNAISVYMKMLKEQNLKLEDAHNALKITLDQKQETQDDLLQTLKESHQIQLHANQRLEEEVEKRTQQIREQHQEILLKSEELRVQNEKISSQNEQLEKIYQKMTKSINYAREIQKAILVSPDTLVNEFSDGFIINMPKDIISGDFYWFYKTEQYKFIILSDCTGHGVPAAFMTVIGNAILHEVIINNGVHEPDLILKYLDQRLHDFLNITKSKSIRDGMDIAIVRIDEGSQKLRFSGAKRPMLLRNINNKILEFKGSLVTIGYAPWEAKKEFVQKSISYKKGDQLYLFSDGFQDQFGGVRDTRFQKRQLYKLLHNSNTESMKEEATKLKKALTDWKGGREQTDDILFVGLKL
ncbi:SpoIIE family protein phosphatase [Sediminitomix flava]|uniref:Serine phosphatase RsbU (Regulator of sigma subunit) n=1 Tax=Sediminitomix flava TaxID=379075 RepID=A0A315ZAI9_SEDFL|nr:SpoIIE family protein phosphatase [Sediminitomix flava]PWJ41100.1 serine phosphatase RsbU (regulator of sigma subunit) [Sediminitomix flava]